MNTSPIAFTWKDKNDQKLHWGIGAQSFEKAAIKCGLQNELGALDYDAESDIYSINYDEA